MAADATVSANPLAVLASPGPLQNKPRQVKEAFEAWVKTQPPWVAGVSSGFFGAFQGAFLGTLMGTMARGAFDQPGGAGKNPTISILFLMHTDGSRL